MPKIRPNENDAVSRDDDDAAAANKRPKGKGGFIPKPERIRRKQIVDKLREGATLDLEGIEAVAETYNDTFRRLAKVWAKEYFAPARVELFREGDEPDNQIIGYFGFRRQDSGWGFVVEQQHVDDIDGESWSSVPIASASLDQRMHAIQLIDDLEEELQARRNQQRDILLRKLDILEKRLDVAKAKAKTKG